MPPTKPPVPYYGGKVRLAGRIAAALPPHTHYVEPYAGSLAVLLAKPPSRMETVNDLDGDLVHFWRVLRERPEDLARACALTPHSRAEHAAALAPLGGLDDVERARRVWVRLTQGRAGTLRPTGWRHYVAGDSSSTSMPGYLNGYLDRMAAAAARMHAVSLECRPALEVVAAYGRARSTLLYVDPPYPGATGRDRNYRTEMMGEAAHRDLAAALRACRATVVLSGYPGDLYDTLFADWHRTELASGTSQGGQWEARTEVLWSNRPLAAAPAEDLFAAEFRNTPAAGEVPCNETAGGVRCAAPGCGLPVDQPATGRRRKFCSAACRVRAHRVGSAA
jgi:DNA adenine methylase